MSDLDINFPLDKFENLVVDIGWNSLDNWFNFWKNQKNVEILICFAKGHAIESKFAHFQTFFRFFQKKISRFFLNLDINFILNLFLSEASNFVLYRFITKLTNPIINITNKITPSFIVRPLVPIYIAWLIFMIRIYILPLILEDIFGPKILKMIKHKIVNKN